jgi:hypothetical protein
MKFLFVLHFLFLLITTGLFAQNVSYQNETIYADDQPYAIMKKTGGFVPDYSVRTLDNKEIMIVHFDKGDGGTMMYLATFIGSGMQAFMKNDLGFGKKLAKEIVENNLIKNGDLNPAGEKRFLMLHSAASGQVVVDDNSPPQTLPTNGSAKTRYEEQQQDTYVPVNAYNSAPQAETDGRISRTSQYSGDRDSYHSGNNNNYTTTRTDETTRPRIVERDRGQNIYVAGDRIRQDNRLIGNYTKTTFTLYGEIYNVFTFFLPDGSKIAEAKIRQFNADSYKLVTINDNKVRDVSIKEYINIDFDQVREISKFLSKHYYL